VSSYVSLLRYISPPGLLDTEEGLPIALRALRNLPEYPENLLTRKENHGCIVFHISDQFGSAQFKAFKQRFDELKPDLSSKADFRINGYVSMAYDSINYIAESLLYSLGISIGFITLALIIYLRSAPLAIICLIPNVLPIMVMLGLAGWLQIPVSVGMIVIFMIGLGIAVDDTVHLVIKFLQSRKKNPSGSIREHLDEAVSSTGFAIFLTSIVILAAAVTFLQSSFSTLRETGIVLSTVTIAAILADLFVFPWIIEKYYQVVLRLRKTP
jgi:predicted RND superfamily exporter protein